MNPRPALRVHFGRRSRRSCPQDAPAAPPARSTAKPSPFYLGADISTLSEVERRGGVYMDGGKPGDALAIFMKNGWTCFRLRIWVDPRERRQRA